MLVIRFFNFSARFTFQRTCLPARLTDMKRLPIRELTPVGSLSRLNVVGMTECALQPVRQGSLFRFCVCFDSAHEHEVYWVCIIRHKNVTIRNIMGGNT